MGDNDQVLTCAEMRAVEQAAIASGAVTGLDLMERAGAGVVGAILDTWPEMARAPHRVVVLCGPGNNGGDGYVVARLLAQRGWAVTVHAWGDPAALPPDARTNHDRWAAMGAVNRWDAAVIEASEADLYVDAVFGTGLTRPPPHPVMDTLAAIHATGRAAGRMVAVDAPTGLNLDTGRPPDPGLGASRAALTVTFHRAKPGHFLADGPHYCGALRIVPIGLPEDSGPAPTLALTAPRGGRLRKHTGHKYDHGHALVLGGGPGHGGAARLAARAALRVGAGLVTLGCPHAALVENAARLDAVMLREIDDAGALRATLADRRLNALLLGPGLGIERAPDLVRTALAARRSTLLDADALTAFADDPATLLAMLHPACVLTPHAGEFARLFPDLDPDDPLAATRAAAARADCTVLLKGPATVIAAADGRVRINAAVYAQAAPWLATAGSGDVLAGLIAGLLARGFDPLDAASTGAWLHAAAARAFGPGLIADDLPDQIPRVFRSLGL